MPGAEPELVLVRHGETEWSRSGRHTGRTDLPLTAAGRAAAEEAAALAGPVDGYRVVTSPLLRARQTCELFGLSDRARVEPDVAEWDYGDYEGLTTTEILQRDPDWSLWRDGCPGGESPAAVQARVDAFIAGITEDTIVFAHGHLLRVLGARWLGQPVAFGARLQLATAAVSRLGWEHGTRAIRCWNRAPAGGR